MNYPRLSFLLVAAGIALTTCCGPSERLCTAMGCASGIGVSFPGLPTGKYSVHVIADGKKSRHTCEASPRVEIRGEHTVGVRGGPCGININGKPKDVTITLRGARIKTETRRFKPVYKDYRPNGPRCEPVCQSAKIVFQ